MRRHPWYVPNMQPGIDAPCRECQQSVMAPIHRPPKNRREFWLAFFGLLR